MTGFLEARFPVRCFLSEYAPGKRSILKSGHVSRSIDRMPDVNHQPQTVQPYRAPFYLRNAHLQTVLNTKGPRSLRANRLRQRLQTEIIQLQAEDGTRLLAEYDRADAGDSVVVLLHGWEGSSRSAYCVTTAAFLVAQGFDVLRLNLRDHGDSHHLNRELFNSTRSPEVASAIGWFFDQYPYQNRYLAGFSLGGSFALRVAADAGGDLGVRACVAISPPIDPARVMDALNSGFFAYERYFYKLWSGSLRRKFELFPDLDDPARLKQARSLDDLNRLFIPRHTDFERVEDYFAAYSLAGSRLAGLAMPSYLIAAEDDPIIPISDLERIDPIEQLHIERHRHGGHCGFLQNLAGESWVEPRLVQLLRSH